MVRTPLFFELSALVSQFFPNLANGTYSIKYVDSDNDQVTATSDAEVRDAWEMAKAAGQPLRFIVVEKPAGAGASSSSTSVPTPTPTAPAAPADLSALSAVLPQILATPGAREVVAKAFGLEGFRHHGGGRRWAQHHEAASVGPVPASSPSVHHGITCDACHVSPIVGARWKCTQCSDYDNCSTCEEKKVHDPSHVLVKYEVPTYVHPHHRLHSHLARRHFHHEASSQPGFGPCSPGSQELPAGLPCGRQWAKLQRSKHLARFVSDVTIEDGSIIPALTKFEKTWRIRNTGSVAWPEQTVLTYVGGDSLSEARSALVGSVPEGGEVNISVQMTAPQEAGRYQSFWRLSGPDGVRFGQRVWVDFIVPDNRAAFVTAIKQQVPVIPTAPEAPLVPEPVPAVTSPFVDPLVSVFMTPEEVKALAILTEMGFGGDLISVLRKHNGLIVPAVRELCGN